MTDNKPQGNENIPPSLSGMAIGNENTATIRREGITMGKEGMTDSIPNTLDLVRQFEASTWTLN